MFINDITNTHLMSVLLCSVVNQDEKEDTLIHVVILYHAMILLLVRIIGMIY